MTEMLMEGRLRVYITGIQRCLRAVLLAIILFRLYIQFMTFQFKTKQREQTHEQCQKEITLLKEYNKALEKENQSRNQQRKALQAQIQRLTRLQQTWKLQSTYSQSRIINITQNREYIELKKQYAELKSRYDNILVENMGLNSRVKTVDYGKDSRIVLLEGEKAKLSESVRSYEVKISSLEAKILGYQREISELKNKNLISASALKQQYTSKMKIQQLQLQLKSRNDELIKSSKELMYKQQQLSSMKRQVSTYAMKIDSLSQQLSRLQKSQKTEAIRYIEMEDVLILRSKLQHLNNANSSLFSENTQMRSQKIKQSQYISSLLRRIDVLQNTNNSLQNEVQSAISAKNQLSKMVHNDDKSLREAVYSLKEELQQLRNFNHLVRQQNEQLYKQIQQIQQTKSSNKCQRCNKNHGKSRSKSPIFRQNVIKSKQVEVVSKIKDPSINVYPPHQVQYSSLSHSLSQIHKNEVKSNKVAYSVLSSPYSKHLKTDLQRKIQALQNQNEYLKQHLVHQV